MHYLRGSYSMKRFLLALSALFGLFIGCIGGVHAQGLSSSDSSQFIPVELSIRGLGRFEINMLYQNSTAYIPMVSMFKILNINVNYNASQRLAEGFYLDPARRYSIDGLNRSASAGDKSVVLSSSDVVSTAEDLYVRTTLYQVLFNLELTYNPRRLEVSLKSKERLPIFLQRDRDLARRRKRGLYQLPEPEYTEPRRFTVFDFGRLDYSFTSQISRHGVPRQAYAFHLGNQILGGDFEGRVNGRIHESLTSQDVTARLRYAFLNNSVVRQIIIGDILTTGLIPSSVLGIEVTNRPAPRRYFFASEELDGSMSPGGIADFYLRGSLVDFQTVNPEGAYSFSAPIIYGVSNYQVRQYDAFGVERLIDYRIVVPPTMIPSGEVEYSLVGGRMRLKDDESYGNGTVRWGVNSFLTLGTGFDYFKGYNPYSDRKIHPMLTATGRLTRLLVGDFTVSPSAFSRGILSLTYPSSAGGSFGYTWYNNHPFYNPRKIISEATATATLPFTFGLTRVNLDVLLRQTMLEVGRDRVLQPSLGGQSGSLTYRITHRRTWRQREGAELLDAYTTLSMGIRAPGGFNFRGTTRYHHYNGGFKEMRLDFSKRFSREVWLQIFYDKSFITQNAIVGLQFVYYFPFALFRTVFATSGQSGIRTSETVSGSIGFSPEAGDFYFDYLSNRVGFGGIIVDPYVDINNNGIHDPGEEEITKARISASTMFGNQSLKYTDGGGFGLRHTLPYEEYVLSMDPVYLDNPLWIPKYSTVSVVSEPNQFRVVDLPIVLGGIVRGRVQLENGAGVEGVTVSIIPETEEPGKEIFRKSGVSFSTGEFEFIGVPPGRYKISIDERQLEILRLRTGQSVFMIDVVSKPEGDEISNIIFNLTR